ncbi:MAG: thermonuclease family protein [Pseudomonadota bacterium]
MSVRSPCLTTKPELNAMSTLNLVLAAAALSAAFAYYVASGRWRPGVIRAQVHRVIDGESFQLAERKDGFLNVRIAGVRAPSGPEHGADWAKDTLATLISGKACELRPVDEDPDGFLIAKVRVDGRDVGELLVERGHAQRSDTLFRGAFRHPDEV